MSTNMPDLAFLKRLAEAAAEQTLHHFRSNTGVDNKLDAGFDPVTEGDRAAERAIRALIEAEFPEHGIVGEEYGVHNPDASHIWVIDPIDGTRAFISGVPVWGTLVGLTVKSHAKIGFIQQPYNGELFVADGTGSQLITRNGNAAKIETRKNVALKDAIIFTTAPELYKGQEREGFDRLQAASRLCRFGTDCYGGAMVAAGHADIFIECGLQSYDIVGIIPVIEQAGGAVIRVGGGRPEEGGTIIAAGSQALAEETLALFTA